MKYCFFIFACLTFVALENSSAQVSCTLTQIASNPASGINCTNGSVTFQFDNSNFDCLNNYHYVNAYVRDSSSAGGYAFQQYQGGGFQNLVIGGSAGTHHVSLYWGWNSYYPIDSSFLTVTIPLVSHPEQFYIADIFKPTSSTCHGLFSFNRINYDCVYQNEWTLSVTNLDTNNSQTNSYYSGTNNGGFPLYFYCVEAGQYQIHYQDIYGITYDTLLDFSLPPPPTGNCNASIVIDPYYTRNPALSCGSGIIEFQYFDQLNLPNLYCCKNPWKAVLTGPNGYKDSLISNYIGNYEDFYDLHAGTYTISASRFHCTVSTTVTLTSVQPHCDGIFSLYSQPADSISKGCYSYPELSLNFGQDLNFCRPKWGYTIVDNLDSLYTTYESTSQWNLNRDYIPVPVLKDNALTYSLKGYYYVDTMRCNVPAFQMPHVYEKACDVTGYGNIYHEITDAGNDGEIWVNLYTSICKFDTVHAYIYTSELEDGTGKHEQSTETSFLIDSLSPGSYHIKLWYGDTACSTILGPFELVGPESVVKNISINTTNGSLVYSPFDGVVVYAYHGADAEDSTITDANGHFTFSNLDENLFYTLKFYFQDSAGAANDLFIEYEYTGYKPGDAVGEILMPYTMLKQTRAVLDTLRSKGNYNIQYQFGPIDAADVGIPLNDLLAQQRAMYNVSSIDSLLNDWRTIDKVEAQVVIDNLGRTYIAMAAHNEFEKDAIELSKIPPKALFEIVLMALSVGDMAEKFSEFVYPSGLTKLIKSTAKSFLTFSLENLTSVLEKSIEPLPSSDDKVLMQRIIKALKLSTIALNKVKIPGTKDVIKMAKGVLNDQMFILLHEHYISHTQLLIDNLYNKAKLVVPPDGVFHEAYSQVLLANNLSIVDSAHAKTEHALDLCNTLFDNNEKLDAVTNVLNLVVDARAITGNSVAMDNRVKFLRKVTFLFDVFNAANITGALYTGWLRYMENMVEQVGVNTEAYSPGIAQNRNRGITSLSNTNLRTINTTSLCDSISKYNTKLDSILLLIQNSHSAEAVETTVELNTLSQSIDSMINYSTTGISAIAYEADSVIIGFDSIYTALMNTCNHTYFQRTGVTFNLTSWFLDTSGTSYIDTLIIIGNKAKLANLEVCAAFDVMDSITAGITTPVRVMITAIDGPKNTLIGDSSIVHIHYRNFGNMLAENAYVKINIDNSYSISQDSIYIGNISGNSSGEINFELYSPLIDTFSVYTVSLYVENGKGNLSSNYIITDSLELCNGIDDNHDGKTDEGCTITLNLKTFIQGFYLGNNTLMPVLDPINHPLICDSIIVELHDTFPEHNLIASRPGTISISGVGQFEFPRELFEHAYYIVVRHRNSIETWSKAPVVFGMNTNFDFTTTE